MSNPDAEKLALDIYSTFITQTADLTVEEAVTVGRILAKHITDLLDAQEKTEHPPVCCSTDCEDAGIPWEEHDECCCSHDDDDELA